MYQVVQAQIPACRNDRQHAEQDQLDEVLVDQQVVAFRARRAHSYQRRAGDVVEKKQQRASHAGEPGKTAHDQSKPDQREPPHVQLVDELQGRRIGYNPTEQRGEKPSRLRQKRGSSPIRFQKLRDPLIEKVPSYGHSQNYEPPHESLRVFSIRVMVLCGLGHALPPAMYDFVHRLLDRRPIGNDSCMPFNLQSSNSCPGREPKYTKAESLTERGGSAAPRRTLARSVGARPLGLPHPACLRSRLPSCRSCRVSVLPGTRQAKRSWARISRSRTSTPFGQSTEQVRQSRHRVLRT